MLYTVKIMCGKTTLKQFAVIADGDATLQKFAADTLGEQADDTAEMMKFGRRRPGARHRSRRPLPHLSGRRALGVPAAPLGK